MKLQQHERRLAIVLICVVVVLGAGAGACKLYEEHEQKRLEELDKVEQKKYDQTFSLGDNIVLDSEADKAPMPSGWPYEAHFAWNGRLDVTIDRARLYSSSDALLADLDRGVRWVQYFEFDHLNWARKNNLDERYLLFDVTMHNVSAAPDSETISGYPWFSSSFIKLSVQHQDMEMVGFDGMPQEGNIDTDMGYFDLPVGETASYQLVYSLNNEAKLDEMFCYMGVAYAPNKYRVELDGMEVMPEGA